MIFNFILFLVIPLLLGIFLYSKDKKLFLTVFTFSCMLAFIVNNIGVYLDFWNVYPYNQKFFSYLPLNIGLYPIMGTLFIYLIDNTSINDFLLLASFSIIGTVFKMIMLYTNRAVYGNGWNIYYTLILFFVLYYIGYLYYVALRRKKILL